MIITDINFENEELICFKWSTYGWWYGYRVKGDADWVYAFIDSVWVKRPDFLQAKSIYELGTYICTHVRK